ncbi:MAG: sulfotransferase [Thermoplasmatota archaeon]
MKQDEKYLKELKHVAFKPVFILGVHRSGTSILYKILIATGCFNPVTAYYLINYDMLLTTYHENKEKIEKQKLTELFIKNGLTDRGIDRLKVTADFAEEYGFLLGKKTIKMSLTKRNVVLFTELCKKIQLIVENDKPLLLKNPFDFPNFLYLKKIFPNAKFVFIHRHPLKTISSMLNAMKTIVKDKNYYTARLSSIYDRIYSNPLILYPLRFIFLTVPECAVMLLTSITAQATGYYIRNIDKLSEEDYISITYEELCMHPQEILESIMKKLSLPLARSIDAKSLIKPRKVEIEISVLKLQNRIYCCMKAYFNRFNYKKDYH